MGEMGEEANSMGGLDMKFSEAVEILGMELEKKYGHLGFKYKKSDRTLTRNSKNFTYMLAFFSFSSNTKDRIDLDVCYIINRRPFDQSPGAKSQLLYHSLWQNGVYLDIADREKIDEACAIVCEWMEKILIPKMDELP